MRKSSVATVPGVTVILGICVLVFLALTAPLLSSEAPGNRKIGAKVVKVKGPAEVSSEGLKSRQVKWGEFIYEGESLTIYRGGSATLAMYDRSMREFNGPATLTIREGTTEGGTVLGRLTAAVADILFRSSPQTSQAVMATRSIDTGDDVIALPVLTQPAPGEHLVSMPRQFRWRGIRGVPLYRITVYNSSEVMWQNTTSDATIRWPVKDCDFASGQTYYWVIEALVGNTVLRSQAGEFTLLDKEEAAGLGNTLSEAEASVSDPALSLALKARLCLDSQAYSRAMELLDQSIEAAPSAEAYALRAEVNDVLGLTEEAVSDYRRAVSLTATN